MAYSPNTKRKKNSTNFAGRIERDTFTADTKGLEVLDLYSFPAFSQRQLHPHNATRQSIGMERLARAIVETPDTVLQQLVNSAVDLCSADSAGISFEHTDQGGDAYHEWVATSGKHEAFLHALLPGATTAWSTLLERNRPQLLRIDEPFFEEHQILPLPVTDGLLLPWQAAGTRGAIWLLAHGRPQAFDQADLDMMQVFTSFAALGITHQKRQSLQYRQWAATAAAAVADALAKRVDDPLQQITDLVFVAANSSKTRDAKSLARELADPLQVLTLLLEELSGRKVVQRPN